MCERAAKKKKQKVPPNLWYIPEWKQFYMYQLRLAYGLLRTYDYQDIIEGLGRFPYAYSLALKALHVTIEQIHNAKKVDEFVDSEPEKAIVTKRELKTGNSLFEALS